MSDKMVLADKIGVRPNGVSELDGVIALNWCHTKWCQQTKSVSDKIMLADKIGVRPNGVSELNAAACQDGSSMGRAMLSLRSIPQFSPTHDEDLVQTTVNHVYTDYWRLYIIHCNVGYTTNVLKPTPPLQPSMSAVANDMDRSRESAPLSGAKTKCHYLRWRQHISYLRLRRC